MGSKEVMSKMDFIIDDDMPVMMVAEAGVNHNGSPQAALELVDAAAAAGADAVKFQCFVPELLCSSLYRLKEIEMLRKYALPPGVMWQLRDRAVEKGLVFLCTPFDCESLELVVKLGSPAIKTGSGELTHIPFLEAVARHGLPVILSTGASTSDDIKRAVETLRANGALSIILLHCVSAYPAADDCMNIRAIKTLASDFPLCRVGLSDHSMGVSASVLSVALGAVMIEKHLTLCCEQEGPDHHASATPDDFRLLVEEVRRAERMLGDGVKKTEKCESVIGRSIVAAGNIAAGTIVEERHIAYKRPGIGLRPFRRNEVIGRRIRQDVVADELLSLDMLDDNVKNKGS